MGTTCDTLDVGVNQQKNGEHVVNILASTDGFLGTFPTPASRQVAVSLCRLIGTVLAYIKGGTRAYYAGGIRNVSRRRNEQRLSTQQDPVERIVSRFSQQRGKSVTSLNREVRGWAT